MTWGVRMEVAAPVEMYDAMHQELLRTVGPTVDGLHVHLAWPTPTGFQIVEVWESREPFERYSAQLVTPVMARTLGGDAPPATVVEEIDVRGLVLPRGGIAR
jgi:hypothetical protein